MKTTKKALLFTFCAVLLVVASVLGTMAYLTSSETVTNTFTVGKVNIDLDEAKVDKNGDVVSPEERVKANTYHLLPGHEYVKDPTVTVESGSEESYVRMIVTINEQSDLDAIFAPNGLPLNYFFDGVSTDWTLYGEIENTGDTRSYEFRYNDTVAAPDGNVVLDALFETIKVPGEITKEQLETISELKIEVEAHAIQADGFANADEAWAAFKK